MNRNNYVAPELQLHPVPQRILEYDNENDNYQRSTRNQCSTNESQRTQEGSFKKLYDDVVEDVVDDYFGLFDDKNLPYQPEDVEDSLQSASNIKAPSHSVSVHEEQEDTNEDETHSQILLIMPPIATASQPHYSRSSRPPLDIMMNNDYDEKEHMKAKKGDGKETRDLLKSYNSQLTKNLLSKEEFKNNTSLQEYKKTRGDNLDAVCEMLGFKKEEHGASKSFIEHPANECDAVQDGVLNYVSTLSVADNAGKTFASDILTSNCCFSNKLLRLKYADKLEEMPIMGPLMRNWK